MHQSIQKQNSNFKLISRRLITLFKVLQQQQAAQLVAAASVAQNPVAASYLPLIHSQSLTPAASSLIPAQTNPMAAAAVAAVQAQAAAQIQQQQYSLSGASIPASNAASLQTQLTAINAQAGTATPVIPASNPSEMASVTPAYSAVPSAAYSQLLGYDQSTACKNTLIYMNYLCLMIITN